MRFSRSFRNKAASSSEIRGKEMAAPTGFEPVYPD